MNASHQDEAPATSDYGNWVSTRLLMVVGSVTLLFAVVSVAWRPAGILAALALIALLYFVIARYQFSSAGGGLQARIRELVLLYLPWDGNGEALDVGCGNGPLVIQLAKRHPRATIIGIDYWGAGWDYSQQACESNAEREGVADRVTFRRATASSLPYDEGTFDAVVSNFVFHEVADTSDKRILIREALRVLRPGGLFCFQDLFLEKAFYGELDHLLNEIRSWGVDDVSFVNTSELEFVPGYLKLPFMLGKIGILYGKKIAVRGQ